MQKPDGLVVVLPSCHPGNFECIRRIIRDPAQEQGSRSQGSADAFGRDGTLVFTTDELYHRLKLTDIPGIGHRQEKNLNQLGIKTLTDLRDYPRSLLVRRFGINGEHLYNMGQLKGSWKPVVEKDESIKSIGHMYTLPIEFREKKFFAPVLYKLCEMVAKRMRKQGLMGNVIHFYAHDKNYEGFEQSLKLGFCVYDGREIFMQCMGMLEKFSAKGGSASGGKLIGVAVAGLRPYANQLSLFGHEERIRSVALALDKINTKYGDFTLCRVPLLSAKQAFQDSVGFGRIKEK
jgi:DNA polymerase-4